MGMNLFLPLVVIFGSVAFAAAMAASYLLRRSSAVDRRLRTLGGPSELVTLTDLDLSKANYGSLDRLANALPKSPKEMSKLRRRMTLAGYERPEAAVIYALAELVLP